MNFLAPLVVFFVIVVPTSICVALRIINLDSPRTAFQGETIQLGCSYSLTATTSTTTRFKRQLAPRPPTNESGILSSADTQEGHQNVNFWTNLKSIGKLETGLQNNDDGSSGGGGAIHRRQLSTSEMLYAIKWYKDGREFYRYIAQDWPHKQTLPLDGLNVDIELSDNQTVVLRNVSLKTSGLFKCEVSTDAPYFVTKSIERKMLVYSLPEGGPMIESTPDRGRRQQQQQIRYFTGDQLKISCQSRESKPASQIDWIINDSLNLSSSMPVNSVGRPIFQVTNKQFVRLASVGQSPANLPTQPQTAAQGTVVSQPDHISPAIKRNSAMIVPIQQPTRYTTYELLDNARADHHHHQSLTVRPVDQHFHPTSSSTVNLASSSLDQLLETSQSTLNFSVDPNLLQLLSSLMATNSARKQQTTTLAPTNKQRLNTQGVGATKNSSWRKANVGASKTPSNPTNSVSHVDRSRLFNLHIKCIARVLHLSMSDEIKMKLVDKLRENNQQQQTKGGLAADNPEAQLQKHSMIDKSSGGISLFNRQSLCTWNSILLSLFSITFLARV